MAPATQAALVQTQKEPGQDMLPLILSISEPVPSLSSPTHALVRVRAVALNPTDYKMIVNFTSPGSGTGCDFCGVVEDVGDGVDRESRIRPGARVCGPMFPYSSPSSPDNDHERLGAFSEWIVVDASLLLEIPADWTDLQGAALGGVGWSTAALVMSHSAALALPGYPSQPIPARKSVLVYGGGTATGTMACQLLRMCVLSSLSCSFTFRKRELSNGCDGGLMCGVAPADATRVGWQGMGKIVAPPLPRHYSSGYAPVAVSQTDASSELAQRYGATRAIRSTEETTVPVRHVLDCITDASSVRFSFAAIARTGGRYACLEHCRDSWRTRRMVQVKEVMGFEVLGRHVDLGGPCSPYTRPPDAEAVAIGRRWAVEMQALLDQGRIETHPLREVAGGTWSECVIRGLDMLRLGQVHGTKLVVRVEG